MLPARDIGYFCHEMHVLLLQKKYLFAASDDRGRRVAIMYMMIENARFNDVDPEAWLADVIARIADHPIIDALCSLGSGVNRKPKQKPRDRSWS